MLEDTSPYLIDYLEVQGVFLPKELQNMAGEPYTENDSMKANAEIEDGNKTVQPQSIATIDNNLMNDFTEANIQPETTNMVDVSLTNNTNVNGQVTTNSMPNVGAAVVSPSSEITENKTENLFE